ncbi:S41 family peptidase [Salinimicrobium soli]|uniref:S41 family peptidase n=1 Tax=Salinimicrobium soli TaxID=1254399 RepID=UPI003AB0B74D
MKKIFFLACLCSLGIQAQSFDSTAYTQQFKKVFERSFFGDSLSPATKIAGLSKAWAEAKFNFANFDLIPEANWDSIYYNYIPKVLEADTKAEYYKVLTNFYTNLKDGHSLILPPKELWEELSSSLPIRTQLVEGQVVITLLDSELEAYRELQPGTVILKINELPVTEYAEEHIAPYVSSSTPHDKTARMYAFFLTRGPLDEPVKLEIKTPTGKVIQKNFARIRNEQMFPAAKGFDYKKLNKKTVLLTINTFNDGSLVPYLDSIFQKLPHPENLVVDLRINGGGNGNNGYELLGYLTDSTFLTSKSVIRHYRPPLRAWGQAPDELEFTQGDWKPYKGPTFKGKVVVLAGPDTYSAAEDFLTAFKTMKRGVVIGQPTGGSTGQPLFFPLPFGGMGAVCSKRDLFPDNSEFIGIGIKPDIEVKPTLQNIIDQQDVALQAALNYLKK